MTHDLPPRSCPACARHLGWNGTAWELACGAGCGLCQTCCFAGRPGGAPHLEINLSATAQFHPRVYHHRPTP